MKAVVYSTYGPPDVLQIKDVEKPVPKDTEVLIRVRAASVNPLDWHFMRGTPYVARVAMGLRKPESERLGVDMAGRVEAVGRKVSELKPGDEVFGGGSGAFAEYACAGESSVVTKPESMSFEQGASVNVAALTALQGLRDKGKVRPGQKVLINGAAGGVGTFAVQIAKWLGADVTGVCSTRNVEMVRSIGADRVIDYTQEDFTAGAQRYDLILDCQLNHSLRAFRRILNRGGTYLMIGGGGSQWVGPLPRLMAALLLSRFVGQRLTMMLAHGSKQDLIVMRELIESGKVTPVIGRSYPFSEVREAVGLVDQGHARGKVVVTMDEREEQ
jgi:NADPH:quinone reductase-like Zn-dependent oxidoreductase